MTEYFFEKQLIKGKTLKDVVFDFKRKNKKIVFTNGCFDILHVGHIRLLTAARDLGAALIVGVNSDSSVMRLKGPTRPIFNQDERMELLLALRCVNYTTIFNEDDPYNIIKYIEPDVLVKGGDWTIETTIGHDIVPKTVIIPVEKGYSTTNIINKINKKRK
jgi:rfaE bifunctional protein nucleotidyltransferase chain/domain